MMVKNIDDMAQKPEEYELRLKYWMSFSNRKPKVCAAKSCINTDLVGALVEKNEDDKIIYIVPLCHMHSKVKSEIELITGTRLVPIG